MKTVDKATYKSYFTKGDQHFDTAKLAQQAKNYDAAITNYTIALINYLDSMAVKQFGQTLGSDNHSAAPIILNKKLNQIGITNFKKYKSLCSEILKLKNQASYTSNEHDNKQANHCKKIIEEVKQHVESFLEKP